MSRGYEVFLASVVALTKQRRPEFVEILIICDFADVFLDEVSGLPALAKEVEFVIDLILDMTPIFGAHYHLTPLELMELKE